MRLKAQVERWNMCFERRSENTSSASFILIIWVRSINVAKRLGEELEGETEIFGHEVLIYGINRANWQSV